MAAGQVRRRRRRVAALIAVVVLGLLVRWLSSDLTFGERVEERSCHGSYCLEHIRRSDWLLLVPTDRFQINRSSEPRYLFAENPFPGSGHLSIRWAHGGVGVTAGSAVLTWDAAALAGLRD